MKRFSVGNGMILPRLLVTIVVLQVYGNSHNFLVNSSPKNKVGRIYSQVLALIFK